MLRRAVFAGSWYPARAAECEAQIKTFIEQARPASPAVPQPVGGVVPHAGWYFSGAIACNVIHLLAQPGPPAPDALVVFGMHLHAAASSVMMPKGAWETPFGELPVAEELAAEMLQRFSFRRESPDRATPDNTIEVQLPFIKYFFPQARLLAMGVPPADPALEIGRAVVEIARRMGMNLKVIGSTDLTHYGLNYGFGGHGTGASAVSWVTRQNDRRIVEAMLDLDPGRLITEALANQNACCPGAAAAAIQAGKQLGATRAGSVGYATSYERSPAESFVGYAGVVF
jgi:AmmeMemoRadiSam system protein B